MPEHKHHLLVGCLFIAAVAVPWAARHAGAQESVPDDARSAYEEALDSGVYGEAEVAAKSLLDSATRDSSDNKLLLAKLLVDLAMAQRLNGNFDAALQNYELAVSFIESSTERLNAALIEPLLGIGKTYIDSDRPDLALGYLDRALHVRHVNEGPHSIEQTETLETMAIAYQQMGELRQAADVADRLYILYVHKFSDKSMEIVPVLLKKGQILGEGGNRREERNAYNEAVNIVEHNEGKSSASLIRPYIYLGNSHMDEYYELYLSAMSEQELPEIRLLNRADSFYESAVELARSDDNVDWQLESQALLAYADYFTLAQEHGSARIFYRDAWRVLSEHESRFGRRETDLETLVPLQQLPPDLTVALHNDAGGNTAVSGYDTGFIVTRFTVTRRGRPNDIGLVEISPDRNPKLEAEVKRAVSRFVYRPTMDNGQVVDTPDVVIRYEFPYPRTASDTD